MDGCWSEEPPVPSAFCVTELRDMSAPPIVLLHSQAIAFC